jgi:hypothetical protein
MPTTSAAAGQAAPGRDQRLLNGVLRVLDRAEHPVAVHLQLGAMPADQTLEGRFVAAARAGQQPLLRRLDHPPILLSGSAIRPAVGPPAKRRSPA